MAAPEQFEGFMIHDTKKWTEFTKEKFTSKNFEDYDVDIENECCGVCGSDVHTITGGWGDLATSPICVGHEIIGKVLRVGSKVKSFKPGQRVGVGAQVQSCMQCRMCKSNNENYCPHMVDTYMTPYNINGGNPSVSIDNQKPMKDSKGNQIFSQGGYSSHSRVHEQFVFPILDNLPSEIVAPMMCAGLTVYSLLFVLGLDLERKLPLSELVDLDTSRSSGRRLWELRSLLSLTVPTRRMMLLPLVLTTSSPLQTRAGPSLRVRV